MGKHEKEVKKEKKKTNGINILIKIISALIIIFCLLYIGKWIIDNNKNNKLNEKLNDNVFIDSKIRVENTIISSYKVNFDELSKINNEVVGWLEVNGTNIKYPVVKTTNNDYYLNHNFEKEETGAGWIFADLNSKCDQTDKNLVIYGHNRRDKSMFGSLQNILKSEWYNNEENHYITYNTKEQSNIYKVFSVYQIENEDYYIKNNFKDEKEYSEFLNKIKSRSIHNFKTEVQNNDTIITLSTCANNNKYRVALHAKLMK